MRQSIELPCPGSLANATTIVATDWQSAYGVGNPANTGDCSISIAGVDASGRPISGNVTLAPGERVATFVPPAGTQRIVAACFEDCNGRAVLEFDAPVA